MPQCFTSPNYRGYNFQQIFGLVMWSSKSPKKGHQSQLLLPPVLRCFVGGFSRSPIVDGKLLAWERWSGVFGSPETRVVPMFPIKDTRRRGGTGMPNHMDLDVADKFKKNGIRTTPVLDGFYHFTSIGMVPRRRLSNTPEFSFWGVESNKHLTYRD